MLLKIIRNLKDIDADHLLENKWQPYAEGVESAWNAYNSIIMLVPMNDIEIRVKMKLALRMQIEKMRIIMWKKHFKQV